MTKKKDIKPAHGEPFDDVCRFIIKFGEKIHGYGPNAYRLEWYLNLIYSPVKSVNVGAEYQIGRRLNIDGKSGIANRIQISGKYIF